MTGPLKGRSPPSVCPPPPQSQQASSVSNFRHARDFGMCGFPELQRQRKTLFLPCHPPPVAPPIFPPFRPNLLFCIFVRYQSGGQIPREVFERRVSMPRFLPHLVGVFVMSRRFFSFSIIPFPHTSSLNKISLFLQPLPIVLFSGLFFLQFISPPRKSLAYSGVLG